MKKWILGGIGLCMFLPILAQQIQKEGYLVMDMVHHNPGDAHCLLGVFPMTKDRVPPFSMSSCRI